MRLNGESIIQARLQASLEARLAPGDVPPLLLGLWRMCAPPRVSSGSADNARTLLGVTMRRENKGGLSLPSESNAREKTVPQSRWHEHGGIDSGRAGADRGGTAAKVGDL